MPKFNTTGLTPLSSNNSDAVIVLLDLDQFFGHLAFVNSSTNPGGFSLDGGANWAPLLPSEAMYLDIAGPVHLRAKRLAGGGSGEITVHAFTY